MKVLFINSVCGVGSTGRICTDLADFLKENGHECKIAYGRGEVPEKYKDISFRIGNDIDIALHGFKSRAFDRTGFGSKAVTEKFIKWVKKYDPDVIHLHNLHGYYINIEILFDYLKKSGKKVIWTLHDCWSFTGHCAYFEFKGCEQWRNGCGNCNFKTSYPASDILSQSRKNFKNKEKLFSGVKDLTVVTPSSWLANLAKQSFLNQYDIEVINNGINVDIFKPTKSGFRNNYGLESTKIILGVANIWDERKGLDDFIELSKRLDSNDIIVLVGVSKNQQQQLTDNMMGILRTDSVNELAELYSTADIFINTTYEDNYPTVNLEAQACGTPAVTYNTGGSVESVPADNVVEPKDYDKLLELIRKSESLEVKPASTFDKNKKWKEYMALYKRQRNI